MRVVEIRTVVKPAALPVTVDEFIDHARLNSLTVDRQPSLIERELRAATQRGEAYCRRAFITQTLRAGFVAGDEPCTCRGLLVLPRPPAQAVQSVMSLGVELDPATYTVIEGVIELQSAVDTASVLYTAGYGDSEEDVPELICEGILEYALTLYESRRGERDTKYEATAGRTLPSGVIDCWRPFQIELSG